MKCQMAEIFLRAVVSLNLKSAAVLKSCKPRVNQRHQSHQLLKKRTNRRLVLSRRLSQMCLIERKAVERGNNNDSKSVVS